MTASPEGELERVETHTGSGDFLELTKPRITVLVTLTALLGFVLARPGPPDLPGLCAALVGTALVAAGASTLNMLFERESDARMLRTRRRPLPARRLRPGEAALFGATLSVVGLVALYRLSGLLPAAVAFTTWAGYLLGYTPLKRHSSLATLVGAIPGALPPVIGWTAATGQLEPGALILFAILFLWQIPHFLAIAWLYREDYARAGLPMLPVVDVESRMTGRQAVAHSAGLLLVSLGPAAAGMAGSVYLAGAVILGLGLTAASCRAAHRRQLRDARTLFLASLVYLTGLSALLLIDRA
jgi:protoheme IX farnesyltransferase